MNRKVPLCFLTLLLLSPLQSFAYEESQYDIILQAHSSSSTDEDSEEIDEIPNRHRVPGHRVICEISREFGVATSLPGFSENIISYEIYDESGCCVAIFAEESGFINYIFSGISGEFTIRFRTPDTVYSGIITIKETPQ